MATQLPEDKIFVCIHHFREEDIVRVGRTIQANGTYTETPRIRPTYRINVVRVISKAARRILLRLLRNNAHYSRASFTP